MKKSIDKTNLFIDWTLLENGLDFLNESVSNLVQLCESNDTNDTIKKRALKYSVLHLISAVEILFKDVIIKDNWENVFENPVDNANHDKFINGDFKSIDTEMAFKRLAKFCNIELFKSEKNNINKLKRYRNKMEHFKINDNYIQILMTEVDVIEFSFRFIHEYILADNATLNADEKKLYDSAMEELHKIQDFIDAREKYINEANPNAYFIPCPECGKTFYSHDERKCLFCYYEADKEDSELNDEYINNILGLTKYSCTKDGGFYPIYECPECGQESLVYDSQKNNLCFCYKCGFKDKVYNYDFCSRCGTFMKKKDDSDICDSCWEDIWNKN